VWSAPNPLFNKIWWECKVDHWPSFVAKEKEFYLHSPYTERHIVLGPRETLSFCSHYNTSRIPLYHLSPVIFSPLYINKYIVDKHQEQ
jgi:hypothetical protein